MAVSPTELLRRMAAGDRQAFAPFYDRFAPLVYPLVLRIVREPADAADLLQEIFWEAWQAAETYESRRGTPETWIVMRARRRAIGRVPAAPSGMGHEMFETLAVVCALGTLDGEDRATFESHLAEGCPRCETLLRESEETLVSLASSEPRALPPPTVRGALLDRLATTAPRQAPTSWRRRLGWAVATTGAACAAAAMTGGFVAGRYEAKLGEMARQMAALHERVRHEEASLSAELADYRSITDLLRDPATRVVALHGAGPSPQAAGRVFWNTAAGGYVVVRDLPPPPAGKTYELWTIAGGTPRAAGLLATDRSGQASRLIAPLDDRKPADVFAITLEPEGGVPTPTGPIVLASR
jgi:anti-sigma-K factor RskA